MENGDIIFDHFMIYTPTYYDFRINYYRFIKIFSHYRKYFKNIILKL